MHAYYIYMHVLIHTREFNINLWLLIYSSESYSILFDAL